MPETTTNIATVLGSAMKTTSDSMMEAIEIVLPYALGVGGSVLVIFLGWKIFKRLAK